MKVTSALEILKVILTISYCYYDYRVLFFSHRYRLSIQYLPRYDDLGSVVVERQRQNGDEFNIPPDQAMDPKPINTPPLQIRISSFIVRHGERIDWCFE